jgi:shikimate kinase
LRNDNPRETLEKLLEQRAPIYAEADYTLDSEEGPHAAAVEHIVAMLSERGALSA